ncbi:hypothetical protein VV01_06035 [Luteipulveratus halotolerans]|uniref:HTH lysR-type domain-containing protein n=2 Tax=Luteipulveratus halotolerans TaxID=1631356 RepID=A0A0L6CH11_9MICO|nr:hypothetical protein VV01_06035 [Luteipulveratus halotolerans]
MTPSVDDLRLVLAIVEHGSIGAAARALRVAQPSASQRLSSIERRCGARLFERDTTGARPTPAGAELGRQAAHIIGHLERAYATASAASEARPPRVGTFVSLSPAVFPALERCLDREVLAVVDHGPALIEQVAEGSLDAAVVAVAEQVTLPRLVRVHALGEDTLVTLRRRDVAPLGRGRRALAGRRVVYSTYDRMGPVLHERLERLRARPQQGPTLPTTIAYARAGDCIAVLPRSAIAHQLRDDEVIEPLPVRVTLRLSVVTGRAPDPDLVSSIPALRRALGVGRAQPRASSA